MFSGETFFVVDH